MFKIIFLCLGLFNFFTINAHPIVICITNPRSLSTAFLRMMESYGFSVFNEPSIGLFNEQWRDVVDFKSYQEIYDCMIQESLTKPVFVKEMSFSFELFLKSNPELLQNQEIYFVFLVRNPHHSIISFYRKYVLEDLKVDKDNLINQETTFSLLCGFVSTYCLFDMMLKSSIRKPLLIQAEDLYANPELALRIFCDYVSIPFKKEALSWKPLENFTGSEWHKPSDHVTYHHWHSDALESSSITKPRTYLTDQDGNPTFEEISLNEHKTILQSIYSEHKKAYDNIISIGHGSLCLGHVAIK